MTELALEERGVGLQIGTQALAVCPFLFIAPPRGVETRGGGGHRVELGVAGESLMEVVGVARHLHQAAVLHLSPLPPAQQLLPRQPGIPEAHQAAAGFQPAAHHRHHSGCPQALLTK